MSLWKWNGVELEIKMSDADFQDKYENAFNKMAVTEKSLQNTGRLAELTRKYCDMFYQLFDDIFGHGIAEKLFEGRKDMDEIDLAYDSFISQCKKDVDVINKKRAARNSKYNVGKKR